MDVDASERRKIKIYAGKKKKKKKLWRNFPNGLCPKLECCGGGFGEKNFYLQIICL